METMQTILSRKSIRSYTGEKVSEETLATILKAADAAPVGMGKYKNVYLTLIEKPELLAQIEGAAAKVMGNPKLKALYGAPTLILVSHKPAGDALGNVEYSNAAIIAYNMNLAAVDQGAGCCLIWGAIMAMNTDPALVAGLGLPEGFVPCCAVAIGKTEAEYTEREIPAGRIAGNEIK